MLLEKIRVRVVRNHLRILSDLLIHNRGWVPATTTTKPIIWSSGSNVASTQLAYRRRRHPGNIVSLVYWELAAKSLSCLGDFPSLNEQALSNLAVLYQAQNNPSPDVIEVWAKLLGVFGATRQDVIAWVTHRVQMSQGNGQRLLTPSDTTSPEPLASPTDYTFKSDPSQSPILPSLSRISEPHGYTPYHVSLHQPMLL